MEIRFLWFHCPSSPVAAFSRSGEMEGTLEVDNLVHFVFFQTRQVPERLSDLPEVMWVVSHFWLVLGPLTSKLMLFPLYQNSSIAPSKLKPISLSPVK